MKKLVIFFISTVIIVGVSFSNELDEIAQINRLHRLQAIKAEFNSVLNIEPKMERIKRLYLEMGPADNVISQEKLDKLKALYNKIKTENIATKEEYKDFLNNTSGLLD